MAVQRGEREIRSMIRGGAADPRGRRASDAIGRFRDAIPPGPLR
jgi:hypothetical protein